MGHGGASCESVLPNTELVELRGSNIEVVEDCEKEGTCSKSDFKDILAVYYVIVILVKKEKVGKERLR